MTFEEAKKHLEKRKAELNNKYREQWPKWTVADLAALELILQGNK